jgi:hypothetical protein
MVLDLAEVALQIEEHRVCLQLGIVLGDGEHAQQRGRQLALERSAVGSGVALVGLGFAAAAGQLLQGVALVGHVGAQTGDQLRDQAGAALELHINAAPGLGHPRPVEYQTVVEMDAG